MMTRQEHAKFAALRKQVAAYIAKILEDDSGCKSYEGAWELLVSYPNYFEDETATAQPDFYQITLFPLRCGTRKLYHKVL